MSKPTVAIVGASADQSKFSNKSIHAHVRAGFDVYPVNPKEETIEGLKCYKSVAEIPVALGLNAIVACSFTDALAHHG